MWRTGRHHGPNGTRSGRLPISLEHAPALFGDAPSIGWLGQAGFWIDTGRHRVLIDPYLSDSLARKHAGRKHPHLRMMPPPVTPEDLPRPDLVLVTHAHTDHMDPETVGPLAARFADLPFVVPAAEMDKARARIGGQARLVPAEASQILRPVKDIEILVTPAAHENRQRDAHGRDHFLGYAIASGGLRIAHPGDTVPFADLARTLTGFRPQIALFPVNGRDAARLADGVPGNMTLTEAVALGQQIGAEALVPHHWGMFDFNTIDPAEIDRAAATSARPRIIRPVAGASLRIAL